ncbi:DDHD domain containing protein [Nitzschia inconspicua]|uniref:DDHD domain containing protein n=1 Tax=Nitzschia inconspicua TaxID=303405 RepID=A0A9K3KTC4_9STRA|nr:DDHD domain containing protein [Nitzschia inconspicua]
MTSHSSQTKPTKISLEERLSIHNPLPPSTSDVSGSFAHRSRRHSTANFIGPLSPLQDYHHFGSSSSSSSAGALQSFTRVSRRAALATKSQFWDSNDAGIVAAQSAVDQWEQGYNALRGLLVAMGHSAERLYGAAKAGANGLEHGLLVPVRDWILLPAFGGVEHVVGETVGFLQSDQTQVLAHQSLHLAKQVPFVGESILVPAMCIGAEAVKRTWEIAKYPIPAPHQVRDSVDSVLTGTKWALSTAGREVFLYVKRADANITRTLSHTQWKVLGSGPYATLDKLSKREIIDHFCERYFSTIDPVARYELAAHVRAHNRPLYHDLVITGVLRERGRDFTKDDEWLSLRPLYRDEDSDFLLQGEFASETDIVPLWFRLPYQNGKRPKRDTPWIIFDRQEGELLEAKYRSVLQDHRRQNISCDSVGNESTSALYQNQETQWEPAKYSTNAKWYNPDLNRDLLLDQKRHAVSFFPCCPKCRTRHDVQPPMAPKQFEELCQQCTAQHADAPWVDALLSPPPLDAVYRPTLWRFYGPGDEIRRATWFLDTKRHGPQPYGEDAQAVLEDAYLFLKWISQKRVGGENILLTVQVPSPDGSEHQLVQFSSLDSATAIGKGLGGAISLFKRRVYRGACHASPEALRSLGAKARQQTPKKATDCDLENEKLKFVSSPEMFLTDNNRIHAEEEEILQKTSASIDSLATDRRSVVSDSDLHSCLNPDCSLAYVLKTDERNSQKKSKNKIDDEEVDHLVLIIHGVGEMLQSFDFFGLKKVPTIVDCCGYLRDNHAEVLDVRFSQMFEATDGFSEARFGRVEYLPVEWHESFAIQSTRRLLTEKSTFPSENRAETTIADISLKTIPNLRQFANDTLMDVLYFMSPEHHDMIIDIVVFELNYVVNRFRTLTGFQGDISIAGHSLGSIITWDILDHQVKSGLYDTGTPPTQPEYTTDEGRREDFTSDYPQLNFDVENAFMLGSPIPVFLMIRNQRNPLSVDHALKGCPRVFNIFHPYDPVSYRIEPLLDPRNADIDPKIMTHWNGGFRFQYQTKRLWDKLVDQTIHAQQSVFNSFESGIAALGLLDSAYESDQDDDCDDETSQASSFKVVTGRLNGGRRIDYMLQEKEIDRANEYVAALAAHSCYWLEKDLSLFIARQICLCALERAAYNAERTHHQ